MRWAKYRCPYHPSYKKPTALQPAEQQQVAQVYHAEAEASTHMLHELLPAVVEHMAEASAAAQGPHALTLRYGPGLPVPSEVEWFRRAFEHHPRVALIVSAAQAAYKAIKWMLERLAALPWLGGDAPRRSDDAVQPPDSIMPAPPGPPPAVVREPGSAFERWTDPDMLDRWALTYVCSHLVHAWGSFDVSLT